VTEPKTPWEQALDLFIYLPVGLAMTAREELPRLAEKGRKRVDGEVTTARAVGQFVVTQGQKEAEKAVRAAAGRLANATSTARPAAPMWTPPPESRAEANGSRSRPSPGMQTPAYNGIAAPPASSLAIPGYDTLSASQVVQRLAGLAPSELEAVRSYEAATRQRRTILTKVAQLQADTPG
jgi:hypothetical protein